MNVTVEHLAPCKKLLRVEIDAKAVQDQVESTTRETMRLAKIPGFRPGKAPRDLVQKAHGAHIEDEARRKLIGDAYRKALEEQNLRPVGYPDIEEGPWDRTQAFTFTATVETEPQFELPDYKGIPVRRDTRVVTDEDVEKALGVLREQKAMFIDLARPVQAGDYIVVNYQGTCEGKPITDLAPTARGLTTQSNFWMHVAPDSFIPGFTDTLIGAAAGEKRTVTVTFPQDFVTRELAGKQGTFEVEILQVKEKQLPEINEAFAQLFGAQTLDQLRTGVRRDLDNELKHKQRRLVRDQLVSGLLNRVAFELPETLVQNETRSVVYDIVRANQERGVPKEAIDEQKEQIYSVASNNARDRVKATIVLGRIAEKEGVTVTTEEMQHRILQMAAHYQIKPQKLVQQLQERGALGQIRQEILEAKVLDVLELYARFDDGGPAV
ncbi:MAG TPA: trigger factor [Verrucomicrobiota bacterium]|nr:trigger factor [Verrucomicrobiota bacterium]